MSNDYDYLLKLLMIGEAGVGKSSVLVRFADNTFELGQVATIGVDFRVRTITAAGKIVKETVWDCGGSERYRSITSSYYKGAHGIMLVYDVTDRSTFEKLGSWVTEIERYSTLDPLIMIIGNKIDLKRDVSTKEGQDFADQRGYLFHETSAKTNDGKVEAAFAELAEQFVMSRVGVVAPLNRHRRESIRINGWAIPDAEAERETNRGGCC